MVLSKPELTGRMAKWSIRLSTYDISYDTRTTIKSQALADFVVGFSPTQLTQAEEELKQVTSQVEIQPWTLYIDGASNVNCTGLGLVLKSRQGDIMAYSICCEFKATNNEAEYEALIIGLITAKDLKVRHIDVNCDSLLIVNHVNESYEAKENKMITYLDIVKLLQCSFDTFHIQQVPREQNTQADALVGLGAVFKDFDVANVPTLHINKPSNERMLEVSEVNATNINLENSQDGWTKVYKDYLQHGKQPDSSNDARVLRRKASLFNILDDVLFKKSATGTLQRCIEKNEAGMVLRDVHEGDCGNHTNGRNLSLKILRMGYYWPTLRRDALDYTKKCDACQRHAPIGHQPSEFLHPSIPSWPFMKWGMDIVGKMPPTPG
ncbi:uncharacterized protein LOC141719311 [Apium graveolens]|uniref:uncharacterized protein LOC141719311 n=1 Tax=Apium graveolens TaxID=4045 RepID=UPI003D7BF9F5